MRENDSVWPALRKKKRISHSSGKLSHRQLVEQGLGVLPSPVPRKICRNLAGDVEKLFEFLYIQGASFGSGHQCCCPRPGVPCCPPQWEHPPERWGGLHPGVPLVLQPWGGCHGGGTSGAGLRGGRDLGAAGNSRSVSPLEEIRPSRGLDPAEE